MWPPAARTATHRPQQPTTPPEAADETDTRNLDLYPDRPDRQDQDHEANIGESVRLAGYTATVTDLVEGGTTNGSIAFDVGAGTYFVIYKPDALNAARGIWQIEVQ